MTNRNQKQMQSQNPEQDLLDRELDAALAKYATVEPRAGLEERILANLRSELTEVPNHAWWKWSAAVALAAVFVVIAVALALRSPKPAHIAQHRPLSPAQVEPSGTPAATNNKENTVRPNSVAPAIHAKRRDHANTHVALAASPKLDVFPSPQPLSEEELALVQYVQSFPKDATLIAQAQEEFALESQREMENYGSRKLPVNSIQQER